MNFHSRTGRLRWCCRAPRLGATRPALLRATWLCKRNRTLCCGTRPTRPTIRNRLSPPTRPLPMSSSSKRSAIQTFIFNSALCPYPLISIYLTLHIKNTFRLYFMKLEFISMKQKPTGFYIKDDVIFMCWFSCVTASNIHVNKPLWHPKISAVFFTYIGIALTSIELVSSFSHNIINMW